jgi:exodeoxyribonuclease VII small subunit
MERLEELTSRLESGSLPLEESLAAYEEGVRITRGLLDQLDAAEKRIKALAGGREEAGTPAETAAEIGEGGCRDGR